MSSHRVTIPEAVRLTGRARRSLYRDMGAGRLSYHVGPNNRRLVDVSELIRAYGALSGMPEEEPAPPVDPVGGRGEGVSVRLLAELLEVTRQQSETLSAQREELAALRREVAELRTLPAPGQLASHPDYERHGAPKESAAPPSDESPPQQQDRPPARSFADLLERLSSRGES